MSCMDTQTISRDSSDHNFAMTGNSGRTIILFYKYIGITDTAALMDRERAVCELLDIKGRIIIAEEGINATLEGTNDNIAKYMAHIKRDPRFKDLNIKLSEGIKRENKDPDISSEDKSVGAFPRLSIKVKKEIVSTGLPDSIRPEIDRAPYIQPYELKKKYEGKEDFVIVDMRNDYELAAGAFDRTIDLGLENSRDLIKAAEELKRSIHIDTEIVTACTGGVRCEKMATYLIDQGFTNVRQLHNGMHAYMEKYPGEDFKGSLYTFDNRKVMNWGGESREIVGKCKFCASVSERYENCDNKLCHKHYIVCDECANIKGLHCGEC